MLYYIILSYITLSISSFLPLWGHAGFSRKKSRNCKDIASRAPCQSHVDDSLNVKKGLSRGSFSMGLDSISMVLVLARPHVVDAQLAGIIYAEDIGGMQETGNLLLRLA